MIINILSVCRMISPSHRSTSAVTCIYKYISVSFVNASGQLLCLNPSSAAVGKTPHNTWAQSGQKHQYTSGG